MVQIQKADRKTVFRYLLNEGVIVLHKDFSSTPHKATGVPNIQVWMILRSLKDRALVQIVFSWQYFYYFLNAEGKKYISESLGLTEEVVPLTWKYLSFHILEKIKKDNMNDSTTKVKPKKSEEIVTMPQEPEPEAEVAEDPHKKTKLTSQLKPRKKKPQWNDHKMSLLKYFQFLI